MLLITLCFFLCSLISWAKTEVRLNENYIIDSLYKELNSKNDTTVFFTRIKLFELHLNNDLEKALIQLVEAKKESKKINLPIAAPKLKVKQAEYYNRIGDYKKAELNLSEAISQYKKQNHTKGIIECLNEMGINASEQGNYEKALNIYQKLITLQKSSNDILGEFASTINMAHLFSIQGNFNNAEMYLRNAIKLVVGTNHRQQIMRAYNFLANIQSRKGDIDSAVINYNRAKLIAIEEVDHFEQTAINHNIGTHFSRIGKIDSAVVYWEKALEGYQSLKSRNDESMILYNIAFGKAKMGSLNKALSDGEKGVKIAKEINNKKTVMQGYALLMELEKMSKNYEKALSYSQLYYHLKDSLEGERVKNNINELNTRFETEKKENLNSKLAKENEIKSLKISRLAYMIIGLIIFVLLIIILSVFYIKNRKVRELKTKIELEQKALRAQINPHFIFNSLNNIQLMYAEGKKDLVNDYLADFGQLLRIVLEKSGKSYISLEEELETLELYLGLEKVRTEEVIDYSIVVDSKIDVINSLIPPLILQPFVENAIWHGILPKGVNGVIKIEIVKRNDILLQAIITDNGIGIEESKKSKSLTTHKSKGIEITRERLNIENAIKIEQMENGGTKVSILIPLKQ